MREVNREIGRVGRVVERAEERRKEWERSEESGREWKKVEEIGREWKRWNRLELFIVTTFPCSLIRDSRTFSYRTFSYR